MSASPIRLETTAGDEELLARLSRARHTLLDQVGRRIVGQTEVLDGILTAVLSGGHALLVGVPGLAKTLMVSSVAAELATTKSGMSLQRLRKTAATRDGR